MQEIIIILAGASLIGYIISYIHKGSSKRNVKNVIEQTVQKSEKLLAPCTVELLRDSSGETDAIRKWLYAFSLNNGEKVRVDDGETITFTTHLKNNVLVGYGRGDYGGLGRYPSLDSPFQFEAVDGGKVELVSKPVFDYTGGVGKWKSNLQYNTHAVPNEKERV